MGMGVRLEVLIVTCSILQLALAGKLMSDSLRVLPENSTTD